MLSLIFENMAGMFAGFENFDELIIGLLANVASILRVFPR